MLPEWPDVTSLFMDKFRNTSVEPVSSGYLLMCFDQWLLL